MALTPLSADAILDLQRKIRELTSALRDKGIPVEDNAPLVDIIQAVRSADAVPDVIELCKEQMLTGWRNKTLPSMRFSLTYNIRPTARYLFHDNVLLERAPTIQGLELVMTTEGMFNNCSSLREVNLTTMSAVTNAANMFSGCDKLREIILPPMPAVENLERLAQGCARLETLTIGEVPQATNTYCMCYNGNIALRSVTITTSNKLSNAAYTFHGCSALETIEGVFDVSGVTSIDQCFGGCYSLKDVYIKGLRVDLDMNNCRSISAESLRYLVDNSQSVTGKSLILSNRIFNSRRSELEALSRDAALKGFTIVYR